LRPAGAACWEWLDIREGIPLITQATQNQLVPQMANLELIGAVSFSKGCYTGQEVVARSQYLGKGVKRRMYLARLDGSTPPSAGDELFSDDLGAQASGLVVNAQPAPDGGHDLLVMTPTSSKEGSVVRWKSPDGPALEFGSLPYLVE
jgi:folate-binding protein YgfZ